MTGKELSLLCCRMAPPTCTSCTAVTSYALKPSKLPQYLAIWSVTVTIPLPEYPQYWRVQTHIITEIWCLYQEPGKNISRVSTQKALRRRHTRYKHIPSPSWTNTHHVSYKREAIAVLQSTGSTSNEEIKVRTNDYMCERQYSNVRCSSNIADNQSFQYKPVRKYINYCSEAYDMGVKRRQNLQSKYFVSAWLSSGRAYGGQTYLSCGLVQLYKHHFSL